MRVLGWIFVVNGQSERLTPIFEKKKKKREKEKRPSLGLKTRICPKALKTESGFIKDMGDTVYSLGKSKDYYKKLDGNGTLLSSSSSISFQKRKNYVVKVTCPPPPPTGFWILCFLHLFSLARSIYISAKNPIRLN